MAPTVLRKRFLAAMLAVGSIGTGFAGAQYFKTEKKETFEGGNRTAIVKTVDFKLAKSCSYTLYEDGQERVKESHLRLFHDNAADVTQARDTANTWVSAPQDPQQWAYPSWVL